MAEKPLKSLKFHGLDDIYKIPTGGNIEIELKEDSMNESTSIYEPQDPLYHKEKDGYFYPLTSEKQVIMNDGKKMSETNFLVIDKGEEEVEGNPAPVNAQQLGGRNAEEYATKNFVLSEIAKAQVDDPEGDINLDGFATKDEIPTRISQLQNDVGYLDSMAFNQALQQAKDSGEFTPKREIDYWTEQDIAEIKSYLDRVIIEGEW